MKSIMELESAGALDETILILIKSNITKSNILDFNIVSIFFENEDTKVIDL